MISNFSTSLEIEFSPIFEDIRGFFISIGRIQQNSERDIIFMMWFQIYQRLSQKNLKHLTKFSAGTISETLQKYFQLGLIERTLIPGTHTFLYTLTDYSLNLEYPIQLILERNNKLKQNLKHVLQKYKKHQKYHKNQQDQKGDFTQITLGRIQNLCSFLEIRALKLENKAIKQINVEFPNNPNPMIPFTAELLQKNPLPEIYQEFIAEIEQHYVFSTGDTIKDTILAWFYLFNQLTQDFLVEVLPVSLSTISRHLNDMVKNGYLELLPNRHEGKKLYCIAPFSLPEQSYSILFNKKLGGWLGRLQTRLSEIENSGEKWLGKEGYPLLHCIISRIIHQIENKIENQK
ncbi:MAG: MarR family transcriptional regulator [Promethearchaeota archaeon]